MPDAPGLELIRGEIERDCPGAVLATSFDRAQAALIADPEQVLDVLRWLSEQPGQRYDFLSSLHAADYLPAEPRFAVHYELINRDRVERIRVKAMLADPGGEELPEIDQLRRAVPNGRGPGAGGVRLLRDRLPWPPEPDPDPDAGRLRGLAAAQGLPGRRGAGDLHLLGRPL